MQEQFESLQNKLVDVGLKHDSFTPEGQINPVAYTRVVLKCVINGNVEEITFKPDRTQVLILKTLQDVDNDVLDLYQTKQDKK